MEITASILLPAFNEEENLEQLLEAIKKTMDDKGITYRIVVVDDGSKDKTPTILKKCSTIYPLEVLTHKNNKGLGEAIKTGFNDITNSADRPYALVVMDADNTHNPKQIPDMLGKMSEGCDVVIASRFIRGGKTYGVPPTRVIASIVLNRIMKLLFPIKNVRDYTSGYRAYRTEKINDAMKFYGESFFSYSGFSVTVETLLNLADMGLKFCEIPIQLEYYRKGGASKMRMWKTVREYVNFILNRKKRVNNRSTDPPVK